MDIEYAVVSAGFAFDEPIFIEDLIALFPGMSRQGVYKKINAAISCGMLQRYSRGVYYRARQTPFGISRLSPEKVIQRKWLSWGGEVYGYVTGAVLEHQIGMTDQVPVELEIVTNGESACTRDVEPLGGYRRITLHRPRCEINGDNASALAFLDLLGTLTLATLSQDARKKLALFASRSDVAMILECAKWYPAKTSKCLLECGAYGILA